MNWQQIPAALASLSFVGLAPELTSLSIPNLFDKYDLSSIKVAIVVSIPGRYSTWPVVQTVGHTGLMSAVNDLGLKCPTHHTLTMEYSVSYQAEG